MGASNSDVDSGSPGGGGSRKKRPTREEMTAIRAPGQRNLNKRTLMKSVVSEPMRKRCRVVLMIERQ